MKKLDELIEFKGFVYKQEFRNEDFAIYPQWLENDLIAYELIKINKNKEREQFGKIFPACESYPTDNQWGDRGWTFKTYKEALKRLTDTQENLAKLPLHETVEALSPSEATNIPSSKGKGLK